MFLFHCLLIPAFPTLSFVQEKRRRPMEGSDKRTCDVCLETFATARELTHHIRKHNTLNSHNCKVCAKTLSSASSLDRHMLIHSGERPFKCTMCPMAFTTNGNMHRHMRTHEKDDGVGGGGMLGGEMDGADYVMRTDYSKPRKRVPSKRLLDSGEEYGSLSPAKKLVMDSRMVYSPVEDIEEESDGAYNCPICGKSFLCKNGLQTHMDLHPNLALQCSMCDSLFRNHRGLRMHVQMTHKRNANKEDEHIPLGFQDLSFMEFSSSKFPLVAQVWCEQNVRRCNSIEHRFICPMCSKAFPCNSALDLHVKNAHQQRSSHQFAGSPSSDKENNELVVNSATNQQFAAIDKLDEAEREEYQKDFMAALQLKPVERVKKVTPAVVMPSPGLLMVQGRPLDHRGPPHPSMMKIDANAANPLVGIKARVMDFADVQQILTMTSSSSESSNPLSLLSRQPGHSRRSPLKGSLPGAMMPGDPQATVMPPTLPPVPRLNNPESAFSSRGEPLSGDVATEMQHIPLEDASRHRLLQMIPMQQMEMTSSMEDELSSQHGSESDNESLSRFKAIAKGTHMCKYCEKIFPFASTLKVHMRTHLGLTPYKCMLCTYSSADKSTLVRHMRTHSGERPYACTLCKFPFTTKANCERHIRKRHNKDTKVDIESCIRHFAFSTSLDGKFCSPDTVCKICNRDFKFFRDLQNHLRVHERTSTKPYVCQRCQMGFTSRGSCARHIVKSHPEVGEGNIERTILVQEVTFSDTQSIATDDSTYLDDVMSVDGSPQSEPLDFSLKGSNNGSYSPALYSSRPASPAFSIGSYDNRDGPIDLSLPKAGSTVGKLRFKRVYHKFYSRLVDALVCPHCSQAFAHGNQFKNHIRSHTIERPHRCYFCSAAFTMKENLDKHIEKRHSVNLSTDRPAQAFIPKIATPMQFKLNVSRASQVFRQRAATPDGIPSPVGLPPSELSVVTPELISSLPQNPHQSPVIVNNNYSSTDASVELSSISKILANTTSSNFQNFLTPPLMTPTTKSSSLLMTALQTQAITDSMPQHPDAASNIPVIVRPSPSKSFRESDDEVTIIKHEPRSESPAASVASMTSFASAASYASPASLASPPQLFMESNGNITDLSTRIHEQSSINASPSSSNEQDQMDEPIPLEKTPAGKELLRKQTCPYCFRKFPWISSLKRHILTHTGIKPYQCPQCGSSFSTKSNCERHIVRRHCGGSRESSLDSSPAGYPHLSPGAQNLSISGSPVSAASQQHMSASPLSAASQQHMSASPMSAASQQRMSASPISAAYPHLSPGAQNLSLSGSPVSAASQQHMSASPLSAATQQQLSSSPLSGVNLQYQQFVTIQQSPNNQPAREQQLATTNQLPATMTTVDKSLSSIAQILICFECQRMGFATRKELRKHYELHHPTKPIPDCYKKKHHHHHHHHHKSSSHPPQSSSSSALDLSRKDQPPTSAPFRPRLPSFHHHQQSSAMKEGRKLLKKAAALKMKKHRTHSHEYGQIHEEELYADVHHQQQQQQPSAGGFHASSSTASTTTSNSYSDLVMKFTMKPPQHSCHMCSKRFKSSTALKRHHRVHTLEHPFQCVKCQASFTTKFNCQRHMQKLHGMSKEEVANLQEVERQPSALLEHDLPTMVAFGNATPMPPQQQSGDTDSTDIPNMADGLHDLSSSSSRTDDAEIVEIASSKTSTAPSMNMLVEDQMDNASIREMVSNVSSSSATMIAGIENLSDDRSIISRPTSLMGHHHVDTNSMDRNASTSPFLLPSRKELCNTPSVGDDDDENEDLKKFKELDPDITIVNPKTPSNDSEGSNNVTWNLDSNVTTASSPESNMYAEEEASSSSSMHHHQRQAAMDTTFSASSPGDGMMEKMEMENSDIIQNLLGIQDSSVVDQMLDTGDSQTAAKLLGV